MTYSARTREPNQVLHCHGGGSAGGINGLVYRVILFATGVILAIAGVAIQTRAQATSPSAENQPTQEVQVQLLQPPGANNATAPVTITVRVNDEVIDRLRIDAPGEREYSHPVSVKSPVTVRLDIDPVWISDGAKLGVMLWSIGFEERAR